MGRDRILYGPTLKPGPAFDLYRNKDDTQKARVRGNPQKPDMDYMN